MNTELRCPSCDAKIELTEIMRSQAAAEIRRELEEKLAPREAKLEKQTQELEAAKAELEDKQESLDEQVQEAVKEGLKAEKTKIIEKVEKDLRSNLEVELREKDEEAAELRASVKKLKDEQLALRKQERALKEQADNLELEAEKRVSELLDEVRAKATRQANEKVELELKSRDETIRQMTQQLEEAKRRAEKASQQHQGEVQEIVLEEKLAAMFPRDRFTPVPKGTKGGDVIQVVVDDTGHECGSILWESKRTKNWEKKWLPKLRDDQRAAKARLAVMVSQALPKGVSSFSCVDEVWVTPWAGWEGVATVLRANLHDVGQVAKAQAGQSGKMEMLYQYLSGTEFRARVMGMVESYQALVADLQAEKKSMHTMWAKREKQLERAMVSTQGLYGDIQGIAGAAVESIEGLDQLALPGGDD